MNNPVKRLRASLEEAIELIDESQLLPSNAIEKYKFFADKPSLRLDFSQAASLLERCNSVDQQYEHAKPIMRIVHHLACSGGTLISKCISAMPNVYLLSELHPFSHLHLQSVKPKFLPSDIISLSKYAGIPDHKTLVLKLFEQGVNTTYKHLDDRACQLIIRDHTHSDYNLNELTEKGSSVVNALKDTFEIRSILTVRNPIDSFASLIKNKWEHFQPFTFDEYCRRFNKLLYDFEGSFIVKFEDFVSSPHTEMQKMCNFYGIPYSPDFDYLFDIFSVTGDSGRSSNIIGERVSLAPTEIIEESLKSLEFKKICDTGLYIMPELNSVK
jgi:hypothetical protein